LFCLLVLSAGLCGCSQIPTEIAPRDTLRLGVAAPPAGIPGTGVQAVASNLISEQLVGIGWDGRPAAKLAAAWETLPDGSMRFQINPKATFHDGSPVTAEIVRRMLQEQLDANRAALVTYPSITAVDADADGGVTIRLSRPEPFLMSDLAAVNLFHPDQPDMGFGPYREVERDDKARRVRLEAHTAYYRGPVGMPKLVIQGFEEQRTAWAALMRDEIDAVHEITPGSIDFAEADSSIKTYPFVRPYFIQLAFNMRHPVLGLRTVRQALSQAVDRDEIIRTGLNGKGVVADGPIWPFHWAYGTAQATYKYNPEAAILRLDAAGLRPRPSTQTGRMPSRFRFTCLTVPDARYEKLAIVLQKQLSDVGVDMQIEVLPLKNLVERLQAGTYEAFLLERSSGRSLVWIYTSFHSKYFVTGYTAADGVLERLRSAASEPETRAAVVDLQRIFYEDPPAVFLVWPQIARAVSTRFTVPSERGRDVFGSLWQWRPVSGQP
jgi:peptide/nickel transport system substrate-binding protein